MCTLMNILDRGPCRRALVLLLVCALTACSTLHAVPGSGSELQQRIRSGALVGPGDLVRVSTGDDSPREFRVTAVEADYLVGPEVRIPIDSITGLEIRDYGTAKTVTKDVLLVALGILLLCGVAFLYASEAMSGIEFSSSGG